MNNIYETLDEFFKVTRNQERRINELQERIDNLEARLNETLKPQEVEKERAA